MGDENKVFANPEGYLEIVLVGDQTGELFEKAYDQAIPILDEMRTKGQPVLGLFDLSRQTGFSLSSDKVAMELLEEVKYDKIAMYSVPHREVTKGIIIATGKADTTKIFDTRDEAVAWLLQDNEA
jgi:hypothetical protein